MTSSLCGKCGKGFTWEFCPFCGAAVPMIHGRDVDGGPYCPPPRDGATSSDRIDDVTCAACLRLALKARTRDLLTLRDTPPGGMTVPDAIQLMRKALPDTRLSIEFELNFSSSSEKVELEVSTWNGHEHYYGPTLKAAVELLLLKEGEFEGSPEEADRILREAMAYQQGAV